MQRNSPNPYPPIDDGTLGLAIIPRAAFALFVAVFACAASEVGSVASEYGSGLGDSLGRVACLADLPATPGADQADAPAATYRGKTAAQWAETLGDKDYGVRWYATYALGRMGPNAAPATPALERILANREEHEYVRGGSAWALGRIGPQAASAVPLLVQTLASKHASVRRNAAKALGRIASANASIQKDSPSPAAARLAPKDIAALARLLGDEVPAVRAAAAQALWRIERHPKALPTLEAMLQDPNGAIACEAASTLGELAADGAPVASALAAGLGHVDEDVRRAAAHGIGQAGPAAIALLQKALVTGEELTKIQAIEALSWVGPAAVPTLTGALGHAKASVRRHASRALGRIGPAARAAEPDLIKAVSDSDNGVRDAAAAALRRVRGDEDHGHAP